MDPVTMVFYGAVCGGLALWSPWVESGWMRFGTGVAVGLVAGVVLPLVRGAMGY
jgi:hypothetical protein